MKNKLNLILILLILISIGYTTLIKLSEPKIAFIDINTVYESFDMMKELNIKYKATIKLRDKELDNLNLEIQNLNRQISNNKDIDKDYKIDLNRKQELFQRKSKMYSELNTTMKNDFQDKVFTQIDEYIKKYGESHNYHFILGANGSGNILYAPDSKDITKEVTEFINNKYNGYE